MCGGLWHGLSHDINSIEPVHDNERESTGDAADNHALAERSLEAIIELKADHFYHTDL